MTLVSKVMMGLVTTGILFVGCNSSSSTPEKVVKGTISEESLGLRKTTIYNEAKTTGMKGDFIRPDAGESKRFVRAFQDAPPMIPHSVEDLLPIKADDNQCLDCHMPDVAADVEATPIPKSHFFDMRPKHKFNGKLFTKTADVMKNDISVKKISTLSNARFNCSQCHAPQTKGQLAVGNTFKANYTRKEGAFKSTWDEVVLDSLDTNGKNSKVTKSDLDLSKSAAGHLKAAKH